MYDPKATGRAIKKLFIGLVVAIIVLAAALVVTLAT